MMTPEQFQSQFMPYAQQVSARTGLDPRLALAQAALETGWGQSAPNNNYFGIKSHGEPGGNTLMTQEFQGGQMVNVPQSFRGYETPDQSFQGYADFLLSNPRYQSVLSHGDLASQISAMGESGYATDPEYANKLASIAARFGGDTPNQVSTREAAPMMPPRERPQGLLQTLGVQPQGEGPQGDRPFYQRDRFKDLAGGIAMAANTLRQRPDQNIPAIVSQGRQRRDANRTAEWLGQQEGGAEFAQMIASGANPAEVLMSYRQSRQPVAPDQTAAMQNYQFLVSQGMDENTAMERAFSSGGVTVQTGDRGPQVGTIPQGYQMAQDPETGAYRMEPIPGGPEDTSRFDTEGAEQQAAGAVNVLEVLEGLEDDVKGDPLLTGILGAMLSSVPGTGAYDASRTSDTVKANLAFDALAAMRAASPTGGALGSVSERELGLLESQISSLDLGQSRPKVLESIQRIRNQYSRILDKAYSTGDPTRLDEIFGGRPSFIGGAETAQPNTPDMSDEELLQLYGGGN